MKKPKLDNEGEADPTPDVEPLEDGEEELPEEAMDAPTPLMDVDEAAPSTAQTKAEEPKIRFKKGKTAEGASAHFKENPYTFIEPDDPIIKACTYASFTHLARRSFSECL